MQFATVNHLWVIVLRMQNEIIYTNSKNKNKKIVVKLGLVKEYHKSTYNSVFTLLILVCRIDHLKFT